MATFVQTNTKLYMGAYDLSSNFKANDLSIACAALDDTVWGDTTRSAKGGLFDITFSGEGFFESNDTDGPDDVIHADIGVAARPLTLSQTGGAAGDVAYSIQNMVTAYQPFPNSVGDMASFTVSGVGSGQLWVRGLIDHALSAETASGTGTGRQLGAISASQSLYSCLHVTAVSGTNPTLDCVIESDDNSGFTTAISRITHTQITAIGSEFSSLAGAQTDDWYRVDFTIGGTDTPTFTFVVNIGVR